MANKKGKNKINALDSLDHPPSKKYADFTDCELIDANAIHILDILTSENRKNIKILRFSENLLKDETALCIAKLLPKTSVEHLYLDNNEISDRGINNLISSLPFLKLKTLDISNNPFDIFYIKRLLSILPQTSITKLFIGPFTEELDDIQLEIINEINNAGKTHIEIIKNPKILANDAAPAISTPAVSPAPPIIDGAIFSSNKKLKSTEEPTTTLPPKAVSPAPPITDGVKIKLVRSLSTWAPVSPPPKEQKKCS